MTPFATVLLNTGIAMILFAVIGGFIAIRMLDWLLARELRREAMAEARRTPGRNAAAADAP